MNKLKSILTDTLYVGLGTTIIATRTVVKVAKTCREEGKRVYLNRTAPGWKSREIDDALYNDISSTV